MVPRLAINAAVKHSLEFAINRVLFKIFGAAAKEAYREILNYFGIDAIGKQTADRHNKFIIRYSSSVQFCVSSFLRCI